MADRDDAIVFARELIDAGYEVHRRDSFLFLFAEDHDSAHALGEQLRGKHRGARSSSTWAKDRARLRVVKGHSRTLAQALAASRVRRTARTVGSVTYYSSARYTE